jgi:hypothetical protein
MDLARSPSERSFGLVAQGSQEFFSSLQSRGAQFYKLVSTSFC